MSGGQFKAASHLQKGVVKAHWPKIHIMSDILNQNDPPLEDLDRDDFDKDLRPNEFAGENSGADTAQNEKEAPSAYEFKELHGKFP